MSDRNLRWGVVKTVSNDKGPHKVCEIECDGKKMTAFVGEVFGVQSVPHVGAQVVIGLLDGDEGKAVVLASMPRPKDRVDGQKEGEVSIKNHDTGNAIKHDKDGHTSVSTKADLNETVGAKRTSTVETDNKLTVKGKHAIKSTGEFKHESEGEMINDAGTDHKVTAGGMVKLGKPDADSLVLTLDGPAINTMAKT